MNKDEYIKEAVSRVSDKRAKAEIKKELESHIADRIEFYTDAGFSEEDATSKALKKMGEAKDISDKLGKIHSKTIYTFLIVFLIFCNMCGLISLIFFSVIHEGDFDLIYDLSEFNAILSFVLTALISRKYNLKKLPYINIASVTLFSGLLCCKLGFASPLLYFINCMLTGTLSNYSYVRQSFAKVCLTPAFRVEITAFYILIALLSVAVCGKTSKVRFEKLKKTGILFIALLLIPSAVAANYCKQPSEKNNNIYGKLIIEGSNDRENIIAESSIEWDTPEWGIYLSAYPADRETDITKQLTTDFYVKKTEQYFFKTPVDKFILLKCSNTVFEAKPKTEYYRIILYDDEKQTVTEWNTTQNGIYSLCINYNGAQVNNIEIHFEK